MHMLTPNLNNSSCEPRRPGPSRKNRQALWRHAFVQEWYSNVEFRDLIWEKKKTCCKSVREKNTGKHLERFEMFTSIEQTWMRKKKNIQNEASWSLSQIGSTLQSQPVVFEGVCLAMPGCSTCWRSRIHSLPVSSPDATEKSMYTMPAQYKVFSKQGELQKLNSHSTTELKLNSTNFHKFQLICRQNKQHCLHDLFLDCYTFAVLKVGTGATLAVMAMPCVRP